MQKEEHKVAYIQIKKYYIHTTRLKKPEEFPKLNPSKLKLKPKFPLFYSGSEISNPQIKKFLQKFHKYYPNLPSYWRPGDTLRIAFSKKFEMKKVIEVKKISLKIRLRRIM